MSRRSNRPLLTLATVAVLAACSPVAPDQRSIPTCRSGDVLLLMAQSVPSATLGPCIRELPAGWAFGGMEIESGRSEFWLDSDRAGMRAVTVTLTRACDVAEAIEVGTEVDESGTRRFEEPHALRPRFAGNRYYVFPGGCITYRFSFLPGSSLAQAVEATEALSFVRREEGIEAVREATGLELCGAGTSCPG